MKKYIITTVVGLAVAFVSPAQYDYTQASRLDSIENAMAEANNSLKQAEKENRRQEVWRSGHYFNLGYTMTETHNETDPVQKSKLGVFLGMGHSYMWPKNGIGGIVKLGIDAKWFDLDFSLLKDRDINVYDASVSNGQQGTYGYWTNNSSTSGGSSSFDGNATFQTMQGIVGMGVGPVITIAPFAKMNSAVRSLRVVAFFHYQPSFALTAYLPKGDNKHDYQTSFSLGYAGIMDAGVRLMFKGFGLGVEGRWGEGDMSNETNSYYSSQYNGDFYMNGMSDEKYKRKFAQTRVFFSFSF